MPKARKKKQTREGGKRETSRVASRGYLGEDVAKAKNDKWWCGDYACDVGGKVYKAGDVQRICFVTPPATGCENPTTLGDGSQWSLTGGCRQDG